MPVPHPTDKSDLNTLPDPELNPLLNPLLAEHMGRWAEVYFTNPPEKREQAIAELLRELESNPSPENISATPRAQKIAEPEAEQAFQHRVDYHTLEEEEKSHVQRHASYDSPEEEKSYADPRQESPAKQSGQICGACGSRNSDQQRFCGMCGASLLAQEPELQTPHDIGATPIPGSSWSERGLSPADISEEDTVRRAADSARSGAPYAGDNFLSHSSLSGRSSAESLSTRPSSAKVSPNTEHFLADRYEECSEEDYAEEH